MAKRYKSFHKYEYSYETESLNALNGAINGPKASCKVHASMGQYLDSFYLFEILGFA